MARDVLFPVNLACRLENLPPPALEGLFKFSLKHFLDEIWGYIKFILKGSEHIDFFYYF